MTDTSLQEAAGVKPLGMGIICFWNVEVLGKAFLVAGFEFLHPDLRTTRPV